VSVTVILNNNTNKKKHFFLLYVDHECALRKGSGFSLSAQLHHRLFLFLDYVPVSDNKDWKRWSERFFFFFTSR